ncbi:MAG: PEP-utilizing enzyme [Candidatus Methanomethylicaceae archaeon]
MGAGCRGQQALHSAGETRDRLVAEGGGQGGGPSIKGEKKRLLRGLPAAPGIVSGKVRIIIDVKDISQFQAGEILVTQMTSPDWAPAMRKARAIVTNSGGITCHAAIVSRELGIPCIVGAVNATSVIQTGQVITVDATHGMVYEGDLLAAEEKKEVAPIAVNMTGLYPPTGKDIHEPRRACNDRQVQGSPIRRHRPDAHRVHNRRRHRRAPPLPHRKPRRGALHRQTRERHLLGRQEHISKTRGRAVQRLQDKRVQATEGRGQVRAAGAQPHDRLERGKQVHLAGLRAWLQT